MSDIEYLDFAPEAHHLSLRERALAAYEQQRVGLLCEAHGHVLEVLGVEAEFTQVEVKNADGDGEAYCEVDGIPFKVVVTYPAGGGDEPRGMKLWFKHSYNWCEIRTLADLGRQLKDSPVPHPLDPQNFGLGTN
jgi:hypothetical protein